MTRKCFKLAGMKNLFRNTFITLMISTLVSSAAFGIDRTKVVLKEENYIALESISEKRDEILELKSELNKIDNHIRTTKKGQNIYYNIQVIAGSVVAVGIVIASYKVYFPPGFRASLSAYVSALGVSKGLIKLNEKDIKNLLDKVKVLNAKIDISLKNLDGQVKYYCAQENYHYLCN